MRTFISAIVRLLTAVVFVSTVTGDSVQLKWDPGLGGNRAFYRVYMGDQPGAYQAVLETPWEQARINGLKGGQSYYVTVRSVNSVGMESDGSPEIRIDLPPNPFAVTVTASSEGQTPWRDLVAPATLKIKALVGVPPSEVDRIDIVVVYTKPDGSKESLLKVLREPPFETEITDIGGASGFFFNPVMTLKNGKWFHSNINDGEVLTVRVQPRNPKHQLRATWGQSPLLVSTPVKLELQVDDIGMPVRKVVFMNGNVVIGEDTASPYSIEWRNAAEGFINVKAHVFYHGLEQEAFAPSNVVGLHYSKPPATMSISTVDLSGGRFLLRGEVASNEGFQVVRVEFLDGDKVVGEDVLPPYESVMETTVGIVHEVRGRAVFATGHVLSSQPLILNLSGTSSAPTASLRVPVSSGPLSAPATIEMEALVTANGNTIQKVQFLEGGVILGEDTSAPYGFTWTGVLARSTTVSARVFYGDGGMVETAPVAVVIGNAKPTAVLSIPVPPGGWIAPATVGMEVVVNPNGNTIQKVQFLEGGVILGEDTSAPYGFTWTGVLARSTTVSARVFYGGSGVLEMAPVAIVVNPGQPPSVVLEVLDVGSDFRAPAHLILRARLESGGHAIQKVSFLSGGVPIREVTSAPFETGWENVPAGATRIVARVVYGGGLVVDSNPVDINIAPALPSPWKTKDIGDVSVPGFAETASGRPLSFVVSSSGVLQAGRPTDSFRFVFQPLTGNGEIEADVSAAGADDGSEIVGLMLRENLNDSSPYVFVGVGATPFLYRSRAGAVSSTIPTLPIKARRIGIKRMVKAGGDTILLRYFDENPPNGTPRWVNFRNVPGGLVLPRTVYVGLVVASSNPAWAATGLITEPLVYQ